LTNGDSASNYGLSINYAGTLSINTNCGVSFCNTGYSNIEVSITCRINESFEKTKDISVT
jgi:hypothetical protein